MPTTPYITRDDIIAYLAQLDSDERPITAAEQQTLDRIAVRATSIVSGALAPVVYAPYLTTASAKLVRSYGTDRIELPPHERGSVSAVAWGGYTVPAADYLQEDGVLVRQPSAGWPITGWGSWGRTVYSVTARWGYGPPPESIEQLALEVAINIWRSKDKGGFTELINPIGGASLKATHGLTTAQQGVIEAEKRRFAQGPTI